MMNTVVIAIASAVCQENEPNSLCFLGAENLAIYDQTLFPKKGVECALLNRLCPQINDGFSSGRVAKKTFKPAPGRISFLKSVHPQLTLVQVGGVS